MVKSVPAPRLVGIHPNPGPPRGVHLTEKQRLRIIFLHEEDHLNGAQIAKRMKITERTVSLVLKKNRETGDVKDRPGRGRKRILSELDIKEIVRQAKRGKPATEIARLHNRKSKKHISENTVRGVLHQKGMVNLKDQPVEALSQANKEARVEYANDMEGYNWKSVLFSDEKTFPLSFPLQRRWQFPGHRAKKQVVRHPKKINVWGACGYYVKASLSFFDGTMDGRLYRKVIRSKLQQDKLVFSNDCPLKIRKKWVYLQDNARPHIAAESREVLEELVGTRMVPHPANSPDLNPMEDVWSWLVQRLATTNVTTIKGLKSKITSLYDSMPWSVIRKSVDSMPRRLKACLEADGARVPY